MFIGVLFALLAFVISLLVQRRRQPKSSFGRDSKKLCNGQNVEILVSSTKQVESPLPFVGQLRFHWRQSEIQFSLIDRLPNWTKKLGSTFQLFHGTRKVIVSSDPKVLQQIYSEEFRKFHVRHAIDGHLLNLPTETNLFALNGKLWAKQRKRARMAFSSAAIQALLPLMKTAADGLVKGLQQQVLKSNRQKGDRGTDVDLVPQLKAFTSHFVSGLALQNPFPLPSKNNANYGDLLAYYAKRASILFNAATRNLTTHRESALSALVLVFSECFPGLTKVLHPFVAALQLVLLGMKKNITKRSYYNNPFGELCEEIWSNKRVLHKKEGTNESASSEPPVSFCPLASLFAEDVIPTSGLHSTETALALVCWMLARNPEAQQKLREEVLKNGAVYDGEKVAYKRFPYIDAVIRETLRLVPVEAQYSSATERVCTEDSKLSINKHSELLLVERGTTIIPDVHSLHRNQGIWGPNANEFRPERWIESKSSPSTFGCCWMAFGLGRRRCPAERMAMLQLKVALVTLVKNFTFSVPKITGKEEEIKMETFSDIWGICERYRHKRPVELLLRVDLIRNETINSE